MEQKVRNREQFCMLVCLQITPGFPQDSITVWLKGDDVYKLVFPLLWSFRPETYASSGKQSNNCCLFGKNQRQAYLKGSKETADGQGERMNADSPFRAQAPRTSQWQVLLTPCLHQRYHIRFFFSPKEVFLNKILCL